MNKQTFWESEVYTLREQIQLIETERNNLVRENAALRSSLIKCSDLIGRDPAEAWIVARAAIAAAKKESGDDAIIRRHLTEGGTPT